MLSAKPATGRVDGLERLHGTGEVALLRAVGRDDHDQTVGQLVDEHRVDDGHDRRAVDEDEVELVGELAEERLHRLGAEQLARVGRHGARRQHVQRRLTPALDDVVGVGLARAAGSSVRRCRRGPWTLATDGLRRSPSMSSTLEPASAIASARLIVVVVLPSPGTDDVMTKLCPAGRDVDEEDVGAQPSDRLGMASVRVGLDAEQAVLGRLDHRDVAEDGPRRERLDVLLVAHLGVEGVGDEGEADARSRVRGGRRAGGCAWRWATSACSAPSPARSPWPRRPGRWRRAAARTSSRRRRAPGPPRWRSSRPARGHRPWR